MTKGPIPGNTFYKGTLNESKIAVIGVTKEMTTPSTKFV
jgi:hypothetical protein